MLVKTYSFLRSLKANNNRDWFNAHKHNYLAARAEFEQFIRSVIERISEFEPVLADLEPSQTLFRIYRDTRFSKDKRPYKEFFGSFLAHGGRKSQFAGYYIHIEPNNSFIGAGVHCPKSEVLKPVRKRIFYEPQKFLEVLNAPKFKKVYCGIYGEKMKGYPRGYSKDFEYIDLLRYKSYSIMAYLPEDFSLDDVVEYCRIAKPFNDFINGAIIDFSE